MAVHKNAAYLNPETETCERGGFFSVDISDPANPRQLKFMPALPGSYHGEGAHVITFPDGRDVLAVNNEFCTPTGTLPEVGGGFALYDVSNPANPVKLVDAAGDYGDVGELVCCAPDAPGADDPVAHEYHSVFMWQDGGRAYLIATHNWEQALTDVDIFDITDPTKPVAVREYDFDEEFPTILDGGENGLGDNVLLHDMVVKEIDGVQTLLASYWDGGYVLVNIEDPAKATYIGDTVFDKQDPLTGASPPAGNAHQAEFSHDNKFILAADEDFDARRVAGTFEPGSPNAFAFNGAGQTADGGPLLSKQRSLSGDTRYVGSGCNPATIPAASPAQNITIAIVHAFNCPFRKLDRHRPAGQRRVLPTAAASGAGAQRGEQRHRVQQRRFVGCAAEPADVGRPGLQRRRVVAVQPAGQRQRRPAYGHVFEDVDVHPEYHTAVVITSVSAASSQFWSRGGRAVVRATDRTPKLSWVCAVTTTVASHLLDGPAAVRALRR